MGRHIEYSIDIDSTPEVIFKSLITPSQIRKWWSAQSAIVIPEEGGTYAVRWGEDEDVPDYITFSTILRIEEPSLLELKHGRYYTKFGRLDFESDQVVLYTIKPSENGSILTVIHTGFPDDSKADEFYKGCIQGWKDTFQGIKDLLESD